MSQVPSFIFGCPGCQREFKVLAEFAGEVVACPHCAKKMRIPASFFETDTNSAPTESRPSSPASPRELATPKSPAAEVEPVSHAGGPAKGSHPSSSSKRAELQPVNNPAPPKKAASQEQHKKKVLESGPEISRPEENKASSTVREKPILPPNFSTASTESTSNSRIDQSAAQLTNHPDLPPSFLARASESKSDETASESDRDADQSSEAGLDPMIAAKLPPRFDAEDPTKIRTGRESGTKIFLPTADGGIQSVNQRTVTVEYQGQKYVLIAMSPEEKRRRAMISNMISLLIAILAIALTLWALS